MACTINRFTNFFFYFPGPNNENNGSTTGIRTRNADGTTIVTSSVPFYTPPFPSIIPLPIVPIPPLHLNTLNDEELHEMEGNLREAVEARIQTLQRIQLLLDAANVLMNQYQNATATSKLVNNFFSLFCNKKIPWS